MDGCMYVCMYVYIYIYIYTYYTHTCIHSFHVVNSRGRTGRPQPQKSDVFNVTNIYCGE